MHVDDDRSNSKFWSCGGSESDESVWPMNVYTYKLGRWRNAEHRMRGANRQHCQKNIKCLRSQTPIITSLFLMLS